jgi:AcrR family transcriptional regulator
MNAPGLRERKKQKTRWAIQEHALRLFAEQGYDATTIDQIAAAAEISPSTFFRYFPTKEDLVIADEYDDLLVEGLRRQPAEVPPLGAVRAVMAATLSQMGPEELARVWERTRLIMSVPALRSRSLENFVSTTAVFREAFSQRTGRSADDFELRVLAGAIVGAFVAALEVWIESDHGEGLADIVDQTLARLESGLSF